MFSINNENTLTPKSPPEVEIVLFMKCVTKTKFHIKVMKFVANFENPVLGVTLRGYLQRQSFRYL